MIDRIASLEHWEASLSKIESLLKPHQKHLTLATQGPTDLNGLLQNLQTTLPYLWLAHDALGPVALASMSDVYPDCSAQLHGLSQLSRRHHPLVNHLSLELFRVAFEELKLKALWACFDGDNLGALGFCRRWGFERYSHWGSWVSRRNQTAVPTYLYRLTPERYAWIKNAPKNRAGYPAGLNPFACQKAASTLKNYPKVDKP